MATDGGSHVGPGGGMDASFAEGQTDTGQRFAECYTRQRVC